MSAVKKCPWLSHRLGRLLRLPELSTGAVKTQFTCIRHKEAENICRLVDRCWWLWVYKEWTCKWTLAFGVPTWLNSYQRLFTYILCKTSQFGLADISNNLGLLTSRGGVLILGPIPLTWEKSLYFWNICLQSSVTEVENKQLEGEKHGERDWVRPPSSTCNGTSKQPSLQSNQSEASPKKIFLQNLDHLSASEIPFHDITILNFLS